MIQNKTFKTLLVAATLVCPSLHAQEPATETATENTNGTVQQPQPQHIISVNDIAQSIADTGRQIENFAIKTAETTVEVARLTAQEAHYFADEAQELGEIISQTATGIAQKIKEAAHKAAERTKEFAHNIANLFRTPRQIILATDPSKVAEAHNTIEIVFSIQKIENNKDIPQYMSEPMNALEKSVKTKTNDVNNKYRTLESAYRATRIALTQNLVTTMRIDFIQEETEHNSSDVHIIEDATTTDIHFYLQSGDDEQAWCELTERCMKVARLADMTDDKFNLLDALHNAINLAIEKDVPCSTYVLSTVHEVI